MPADRTAFRKLVSVHTPTKTDVTGVTRVTAKDINDLARHTTCAARVTRVTASVRGACGHKPCDPSERSCVTEKADGEQSLISSGHTVTRSHSKISAEENQVAASPNSTDWLAHFEERAAIREYEGGFGRAEAERLALAETIASLGPRPGACSP